MNHRQIVLQDWAVQPQPRKLVRPGARDERRPQSATAADPHDQEAPDGTRAMARGAAPGDTALEAARQQGYAAGHEAGVAQGSEYIQCVIDEQANQLAGQLAAKQAADAIAQAELQMRQETAQLHEQLQAQHELLQSLQAQIPRQLEQYLEDAEEDLLALVHETVCRILGDDATTLEGLRSQLKRCLKVWHGRAMLSLHLHPDDLALLQTDPQSSELLQAAGFSEAHGSLRWVADPKVDLGGCLLRSSEGALDARLEVQLAALQVALVNTRAARKALAAQPTLEAAP